MTVYINRRFILRKLFFLLSYIIVSPKGFASNQKYLEKIIKKKHTGDEISICLKELKSGKVLSSFDKDKRLPIASVAKALTASYSLETLGKNYKFKTSLSLDGKIVDKSINGDLYLIGGADPLLSVDD